MQIIDDSAYRWIWFILTNIYCVPGLKSTKCHENIKYFIIRWSACQLSIQEYFNEKEIGLKKPIRLQLYSNNIRTKKILSKLI